MSTTDSIVSSQTKQSSWRKSDTTWTLGLFGTAIGAGVLFFPIRAGFGGLIPILIMLVLAYPIAFYCHRALARLCLSGSNPSGNITETVEEHFGKTGGVVITFLYFFAICPLLWIYGVTITNTFMTFWENQLQMPALNRGFVALFLLLLSLQDVFPALGLNSQLGLICVYLGGALGSNTFLLYGFFNTVPKELDEAAEIDGASHAQVFWTIIMPLVLPVLAVVGLLSFIASFGDFVIARVVLQTPDRYTLAVGMYNWAADARTAPWGLFAAGAVVAAVPVVLIFLYLQRYIVSGLTAGSVKG